jgi:hypothetical protein
VIDSGEEGFLKKNNRKVASLERLSAQIEHSGSPARRSDTEAAAASSSPRQLSFSPQPAANPPSHHSSKRRSLATAGAEVYADAGAHTRAPDGFSSEPRSSLATHHVEMISGGAVSREEHVACDLLQIGMSEGGASERLLTNAGVVSSLSQANNAHHAVVEVDCQSPMRSCDQDEGVVPSIHRGCGVWCKLEVDRLAWCVTCCG